MKRPRKRWTYLALVMKRLRLSWTRWHRKKWERRNYRLLQIQQLELELQQEQQTLRQERNRPKEALLPPPVPPVVPPTQQPSPPPELPEKELLLPPEIPVEEEIAQLLGLDQSTNLRPSWIG